ncbi:hypothetical protein bcgnr5411_42040 [Bacillus cereus]
MAKDDLYLNECNGKENTFSYNNKKYTNINVLLEKGIDLKLIN